VSDLSGRNLVLFDVTGDGTFQFLYPNEKEVDAAMSQTFYLDLSVVAPFGTDLLVAVTSETVTPTRSPSRWTVSEGV
ncbi:hypothetical protein ACC691_41645, partial [Rhizobium johnstonii]